MDYKAQIFPAKLSWPEATDNLDNSDFRKKVLRLTHKAKNFNLLPKYKNLQRLWCFDINEKQLQTICECQSIEQLYIENLKTDKLSLFGKLKKLKFISIDTCSKANTIDDIGNLQSLVGLYLTHFSKIRDIKPLSRLTNLKELGVSGSMWTRMKIESFKPIEEINSIEFLHLTNIKPEDESLEPLKDLSKLKQLDIANFYPMEEFAKLAGIHTDTYCTWFKPYINTNIGECKKCGKQTVVMLTGERKPSLCSECDIKRLNKHVAEFEKIMKVSAQQINARERKKPRPVI
jgi:hypothetical protein